MDSLQCLGSRFLVVDEAVVTLEEKSPQFLDESVHAVDAVGVPRLALLKRAEEHLVEAERVGSVALHYIVGVDNVEHRFRHFFNRPSADIPAVFQQELGILVVRPPCAEGIGVENVVADDVDIDMDGGNVIVAFQTVADKRIGVLDAVNKVAPALNHALIDEFLERF